MEESICYPLSPMQVEIYQGFIDIGRRLGITEDVISKIKDEIHFVEVPTYPDGAGHPLKDLSELGKITNNTNIK